MKIFLVCLFSVLFLFGCVTKRYEVEVKSCNKVIVDFYNDSDKKGYGVAPVVNIQNMVSLFLTLDPETKEYHVLCLSAPDGLEGCEKPGDMTKQCAAGYDTILNYGYGIKKLEKSSEHI